MLLPLAYSLMVLVMLLFHPEMLDKIPVSQLWMKQLLFGAVAVFGWLVISFSAIQSRD